MERSHEYIKKLTLRSCKMIIELEITDYFILDNIMFWSWLHVVLIIGNK